ncbi:hypothetical protein [Natronorubrum sp. A-ect3]|uniref:hypothetical protein n=1 Tax=Natronorubrum sp. A-ect3 TaxID=3242698 RepID=UPI00359D2037
MLFSLTVAVGVVTASNAAVGLSEHGSEVSIPTRLSLMLGDWSGGDVVLLSMFVTDRALVDRFHGELVGFLMG